ncbi:MAG: radical SAM protein, partial [bacterium]|nr:radical SAM protein [bacterium]
FLETYSKHKHKYLRKKTIPRLIGELVYLKEEYGLNFIMFLDDDFLLRPEKEMREFHRMYKEKIALPFWIQGEAMSTTDEKIRLISDAGCISVSMGIETGNEYILKEVMKRKTAREKTINAFKIMHKYGIRTSSNVIFGVPGETRETIFDTIELVRKCEARSINSNVFAPYYGTKLREYAVEKGLLEPGYHRALEDTQKAVLDLPSISKKEIEALSRTFSLYSTLKKERWPDIEKIEKEPESHDDLFDELEKEFWEIMNKRGITVHIPGFDYDGFLKKRREELANRKK